MSYKEVITKEKNGKVATASLQISGVFLLMRVTVTLCIDGVCAVEQSQWWSESGQLTIEREGFKVFASRQQGILRPSKITFTLT